MSLQVWLPLNGNLNNQGLSDLSFSNSNANYTTINNNGKIGKCYNTSDFAYGGIYSDKKINLGINQSMFCWIYINQVYSGASLMGVCGQHRYYDSDPTGMGVTIRYVSSTSGYLSVNTANSSGRTYNNYYGSTLLTANKWYHVGYTYDGSKIKLYVNGKLDAEHNYAGQKVKEDYLQVFAWSWSGSDGNALFSQYKFKGNINDVRIYDHCLSAKEVKDISRGLVLHYKLDNNGVGNENLLQGYDTSFSTLSIGETDLFANQSGGIEEIVLFNGVKCMKVTPTTGQRIYKTYSSEPKTYSVSVDYYSTQSHTDALHVERYGGDYNWQNVKCAYTTPNKWQRLQVTFTNTSATGIYYMAYGTSNISFYTKNWKIEESSKPTPWCPNTSDALYSQLGFNDNIEHDCSGYGNDGTKIGTPLSDNDSIKYDTSTRFNENADSLSLNSFMTIGQTMSEFTTSIWGKTNTLNNTNPNLMSLGNNLFWRFRIASQNEMWFYIRVGSTQCYNTFNAGKSLIDNNWHLYTVTFKDGIIKSYVDGILVNTSNRTSYGTVVTCNSTDWFLAGFTANSENFIGSLSDARIYTTALSDDDVKELYHTSGSIDKNGNVYCAEFKEV